MTAATLTGPFARILAELWACPPGMTVKQWITARQGITRRESGKQGG